MVRIVKYFVDKIRQEKTAEGRRIARKEMDRVLCAFDAEGNPLYSDEDRRRIIEGVESRLSISDRRRDTSEVLTRKKQRERVSEVRKKNLPDSDGWRPDWMRALTEPLKLDTAAPQAPAFQAVRKGAPGANTRTR
jgi:hypothetical protein